MLKEDDRISARTRLRRERAAEATAREVAARLLALLPQSRALFEEVGERDPALFALYVMGLGGPPGAPRPPILGERDRESAAEFVARVTSWASARFPSVELSSLPLPLGRDPIAL